MMNSASKPASAKDRIERLRGSVVSVMLPKPTYGSALRFRTAKELLRQTDLRSALEVMAILNVVSVEIERISEKDRRSLLRHTGALLKFLFPRYRLKRAVNSVLDLIHESERDRLGPFIPLS